METTVRLSDRYTHESGTVLMSGIQALVRLPMDQMRRDRQQALNTGVFISGYRGSPLGGYDRELTAQGQLLAEYNIHFQPGVNEELGATAVWGSQQVNLFEGAKVDGVCGIWYGKTPGVDRSSDAFRHGNAAGSSPHGGVLVVAGDDHGCKSSSYPGQSEFAFVDLHMPVLNPATVQEVLDFGLYGLALSRFSGCWVAMITLAENMDSAATINIDPARLTIEQPTDFSLPEGGLHIRVPDTPLAQEERQWRYKRPAALAFCRKNQLNKVVLENPNATLGIVSAGKAHLDLMQALDELGIDETKARAIGLRILKVGMTYPLDVEGIREFARDLDYLLVVEEKRSLIEVQLKEELYNVEVIDPHFPKIIGKLDHMDRPLLPAYGELSPAIIANVLARALPDAFHDRQIDERLQTLREIADRSTECPVHTVRTPFFCSGCPHNTSTKVPEGSRALAGIGCHYLVQNMNRETYTFTQMGGEGVSWLGQAPFTDTHHVFANLGDGTYFHSGILAIRAAVSAGVNITYKILYNEAVAMTGGQPIDGPLSASRIAQQVLAEGVNKVVVVMEDLEKYQGRETFPPGVQLRHRDDLDAIQRELRDIKGTTVIVYDQACATELRRKRKRGLTPDPQRRVFIYDQVCEGCGDCSVQSNCLSVEPKATELGIKRQINQDSCNKDFSCLKGFCPSFITVEGGVLRIPDTLEADFTTWGESLPQPHAHQLETPWNILVTGVGGTGVVTVSALLAMAAHIEGKAVTTLDQTGLAQKGGAVYSHIRIALDTSHLHAVRISDGNTDALIACDMVAASVDGSALSKLSHSKTRSLVNTNALPTSAFTLGQTEDKEERRIIDAISSRSKLIELAPAFEMTEKALGSTTLSNIFMLGFAYQHGCIPLSQEALYQAIQLNGIAIKANIQAFNLGRLVAANDPKLEPLLTEPETGTVNQDSLETLIEKRVAWLTEYQNKKYAQQYVELVTTVMDREKSLDTNLPLTEAVARCAYQLMAYKDEYEVARLYTHGDFLEQLKSNFDGNYKLKFHLAPPSMIKGKRHQPPHKKAFGQCVFTLFKLLAKVRWLRNTPLDIFGYSKERKVERQLIIRYKEVILSLLPRLTQKNLDLACRIATLPMEIRGFGHIKQQALQQVLTRWELLIEGYQTGKVNVDESNIKPSPVQLIKAHQLPG